MTQKAWSDIQHWRELQHGRIPFVVTFTAEELVEGSVVIVAHANCTSMNSMDSSAQQHLLALQTKSGLVPMVIRRRTSFKDYWLVTFLLILAMNKTVLYTTVTLVFRAFV